MLSNSSPPSVPSPPVSPSSLAAVSSATIFVSSSSVNSLHFSPSTRLPFVLYSSFSSNLATSTACQTSTTSFPPYSHPSFLLIWLHLQLVELQLLLFHHILLHLFLFKYFLKLHHHQIVLEFYHSFSALIFLRSNAIYSFFTVFR